MAAVAAVIGVYSADGQPKSGPSEPMPGMDMPAARDSAPPGYAEVRISPEVQQRIGVTLGRVARTPLNMTIRTVGIVQPDETRVAHIHVKTEGWVERLYVAYTGQKVQAGEALLSIYSPAFFAAQREFLSALQAAKLGPEQLGDQQSVVDVARRRLELWDIPEEEVAALEKTGKPRKSLTLRSPISGTVLAKQVFAGQYVMPQSDLYLVADLSTVWLQAKVFQYELPHVAIGMPASVSFSSLPSTRPLAGKIVFIDPVVDEMSRSVQVRVELSNSSGTLRPGMFGDVSITHAMGSGLTVPASAVIRTGERDIAFRALASDRFAPVEVRIGSLGFGDRFEVLEGLDAGDQVVTSANFLIDSESRLEAGASSMAGMPGMADMPGMSGAASDAGKPPAAKPPAVKQQ
ncbi:MAG TPA: efflux RND transporter periplasmic adaptor subunit [Steroidobacteraceae bacterium]|nr:efflux RND transporter periplasmic adaptor subunit [Steroidobacteraceae bacterium]